MCKYKLDVWWLRRGDLSEGEPALGLVGDDGRLADRPVGDDGRLDGRLVGDEGRWVDRPGRR